MPELPEVETVANDLQKASIFDVAIENVEVFWHKTLSAQNPHQDVIPTLVGQKIIQVKRRAKYLIFFLSSGQYLIVHLRMTGRILLKQRHADRLSHEHLIITLKNGVAIHYHDTRKFGRWILVDDAELFLKNIGPEPLSLSFSQEDFSRRLKASKRQLKPLLLDQTFIAGLGNIYVDEALWEAMLHPQTLSHHVQSKQTIDLLKAIRHVLERGLKTRGTTLGNGKSNFYLPNGKRGEHQQVLQVFRRTGLPCPRCHTTILRILVAQRSTHICPHCQKLAS